MWWMFFIFLLQTSLCREGVSNFRLLVLIDRYELFIIIYKNSLFEVVKIYSAMSRVSYLQTSNNSYYIVIYQVTFKYEVVLSYHRVRGLYFLAVVFATTTLDIVT